MFKINPNPTFAATLALVVPGGGVQPLDVVFRHKGRRELDEFVKRPSKAAEQGAPLSDAEYLAEVVARLDVCDDQGQPLPYTDDVLAQLLEAYPSAGRQIFDGYLAALTEARAKN